MRVTFPRLPDDRPAYALVERDDGIAFRLYGGRAGPALPRDIRRLIVDRALGVRDGMWSGVPGASVTDALVDLVEIVAALDDPSAAEVRRLARVKLTGPCPAPVIMSAAREFQVEAARWARLRVGESLTYEWPAC